MSDNNWCRPPEDFHYFRQVGGGPCDCGIQSTAGLRMVTVERLAALEAAEVLNARLVAALKASRLRHRRVEDEYYACPKALREDHPEDYPGGVGPVDDYCDCGADEHNAKIDTALAAVPGEPSTGAELVPLLPDPPADLGET